jgi:hypothetical protein
MGFGLWGADGEIPPFGFCESNLGPETGSGTRLGG